MNHRIYIKFSNYCLPMIDFDDGSFYFTIHSAGGYWTISTMKYRIEKTFGRQK